MASRYRVLGLFVVASTLFGGTFVAAKGGLAYFPPLLFVAFRFDIGTALMLPYVLVRFPREKWLPRTRADVAGILAAGVFTIGLTNAFIFVGQQSVTSGVGAIFMSLNPILTPVFAAVLVSDEGFSRYDAGGMLLGFVGVVLVASIDPTNLFDGAVIGKAVLLAGAVCGGLGGVLIRRADSSLPSSVRTAWGLPIGALLCHFMSLAAGEQPALIEWTPAGLVALGYVGVFSGALAFIAYFGLLDEVGAIRGNMIFYVVPIVATLGGWVLLGETISPLTIAGFVTIVCGFAIIGREPITTELARFRAYIGAKLGSATEQMATVARTDPNWGEQD
ncbi:DMT family transporter [Halococcus salifodinae]|nr:DMT family transporter [Halococcus salifodinae]